MSAPLSTRSAALLLVAEGERMIAAGRALLGEADLRVGCSRVECPALAPTPEAGHNASDAPALLLSVPEAAQMMGISEAAFRTRLNRGQVPGVVRTGRKVQVHRERFLAGLTKTKPSRPQAA